MRVGFVVGVVVLLVATPPAGGWVAGWDRPHHADLAVEALARLPGPERTFLAAHLDAFRKGALDPDGVTDPAQAVPEYYHGYEPASGDGGALYMAERSLIEAVEALRKGDPDAAYFLGRMSHFVGDLAQPFHTGADADGVLGRIDLLYHPRHEPYEHLAYDERLSYATEGAHPPRVVHDVHAYLKGVAGESAARAPELLGALEAGDGAWTPEVRRLTGESARLTVGAIGDLIHTAFHLANATEAERAALDVEAHRPGFPDRVQESVLERPVPHPAALGLAAILLVAWGQAPRRREPSRAP